MLTNELKAKFANEFIKIKAKLQSDRAVLKRSEFLYDSEIFGILYKFMDYYSGFVCSTYLHEFNEGENIQVIKSYSELLDYMNELEKKDVLAKMKKYLKIN